MAIPLVALMGRPADSVDQYSAGAMNAANIRKTEAEASAANDGRKMQVFQQIGGALKGLEGLPPEQQAAGFDRIKTLALRTWGDNPEIASQIEPLTVQNLPDLYGMFTSYADQMKTAGQMAKDGSYVALNEAKVGLVGEQTNTARANTGLVYRKTADIGEDNARADWNTASMVGDRAARTSIYGSGVFNQNENRDAATALAREKAVRTGYGNVGDGQLVDPASGIAAPIPGYVAPAPKGGAGGADGGVGKLTEGQEKTVIYGNRASRAADALEQIDTALTSYGDSLGEGLPLGLGNQFVSGDYQRARQFANEFLSGILRKDTGAAITEEEMKTFGRTYLPQPGDSPEVVAQKRIARRQAVDDLRRGLGDRGGLIEGGNAPAPADSGVIEYDAEGNPL